MRRILKCAEEDMFPYALPTDLSAVRILASLIFESRLVSNYVSIQSQG